MSSWIAERQWKKRKGRKWNVNVRPWFLVIGVGMLEVCGFDEVYKTHRYLISHISNIINVNSFSYKGSLFIISEGGCWQLNTQYFSVIGMQISFSLPIISNGCLPVFGWEVQLEVGNFMWVVAKNNPYCNPKHADILSVSMTVSLSFQSCFLFSFHGTTCSNIHKDRLDPLGLS